MRVSGRRVKLTCLLLVVGQIVLVQLGVVRLDQWIRLFPRTSAVTQQASEHVSPAVAIRKANCTGTESSPFPFDGCDAKSSPNRVVVSATSSTTTCGFCQQSLFVRYLTAVKTKLTKEKGSICSKLVVYGVAFGQMYMDNFVHRSGATEAERDYLIGLHGECFFTFCLASNSTVWKQGDDIVLNHSKSGLQMLIPIPINVLPYTGMRRNTKLLKMYGGLQIFGDFTERLIWQDAKLQAGRWMQSLGMFKRNYNDLFEKMIDSHPGVCASYRGMPNHGSSVGGPKPDGPRLKYHCSILLGVHKRKVTDDTDAVRQQCEYYQQTDDDYKTSLDSGLIDSAFIVYDVRSDRCRQFNKQLGCTWLDEIHCFCDRDQVSFPRALQAMGMTQQAPAISQAKSSKKDKIFVQGSDGVPAVHLQRGICHWYYGSIFNCTG